MNKYSIAIIVDDHQLFCESFASLIEKMHVFEEVKCFKDDSELFNFLLHNDYNIVYLFLDYYLENKVCINLIKDVQRISKKIKIVIVSSLMNPGIIKKLLDQGPNGFISKASGFDIILQCLKTIEKKEVYICPIIAEIISHNETTDSAHFTNKEVELLQYFNHGYSIDKTAELTNLSKHTIVAHRRNMMQKTNCKSITELLWYCKGRELL